MLADFQWYGTYLRICDFLKKIEFFKKIDKYSPTEESMLDIFFSQYSSIVGLLYNEKFRNYRFINLGNNMETNIIFKKALVVIFFSRSDFKSTSISIE